MREFNLKEIIEGAYYPGVYTIKLRKKLHNNMEYEEFNEEEWQTFIHEYVHYLQDISTERGYVYFRHKAQLLNMCFYALQNNKDECVPLPIQFEDVKVKNALEKDTQLDFYEGDYALKTIHHIDKMELEKDEAISEIIFEDKKMELDVYNIYYDDKKVPYHFGNICIAESMAYLVEKCLFGATKRERQLPYNACELVCENIYNELLEYPERIVQLCEIALMYEDSAKMFRNLLEICKAKKVAQMDTNDFNKFCVWIMKKQFSFFEKTYNEAKKGIDIVFPSQIPGMAIVNAKLHASIEGGHNYRKVENMFISDAFFSDDPKEYFKGLIGKIEFPMIIDGQGDLYGSDEIQNLLVADAVLDILLRDYKKSGCKLQECCKKCGIKSYDKDICTHKPWEQCNNKEYLCPVATYFIGYGVENKKYRWRE